MTFDQLPLPGGAASAFVVAALASGRLPTLQLLCHGVILRLAKVKGSRSKLENPNLYRTTSPTTRTQIILTLPAIDRLRETRSVNPIFTNPCINPAVKFCPGENSRFQA
jgi:hypothetical protein